VRTRLTSETTRAYFLFDALPVFESLPEAMDDLSELLRSGWPDARLSSFVVAAG
jgi:hypothetical protein